MLILLPIEYNKKSIDITFHIEHNVDTIVIKPYNNINNLYKVISNSKSYGINTILVYFPSR